MVKGITRKASLTIKKERVFIVHLIIKTILLRKKQLIEWIDFKKEGRETKNPLSFQITHYSVKMR